LAGEVDCGRKIGPFDCCTIIRGEAVKTMQQLPDDCVDLFFADPPYNKGKADWDKGHDWRTWIPETIRVLKPNGAFWTIHDDPWLLLKISELVSESIPALNWVTWDKYNDADASTRWRMNRTKLHPQGKRTLDKDAEYLIYHADDGQWQSQCDKTRGFIFEPLRAYLDGERKRVGVSFEDVRQMVGCADGSGLPSHWFTRSQWMLPTESNYAKMRQGFNRNGHEYLRREYEDLRREYEDLRREYEDLRPTFNNPGGVSSVWQGPIAKRSKHPTPKPEWLLERIVSVTSNPGDLVADFFMGSGTTAVAAQKLGRHFFGCDANPEYVAMAEKRLETVQLEMAL